MLITPYIKEKDENKMKKAFSFLKAYISKHEVSYQPEVVQNFKI